MNLSQSIQKKSMIFFAAFFIALHSYALPPPPSGGGNVPSYVPSNGLVGWWPFNGNANDESGNGRNGTVYSALNTASYVSGVDGQAIYLTGFGHATSTGDHVLIPPIGFNNLPSYTISIWIKHDGNTGLGGGHGESFITGRLASNPCQTTFELSYAGNYPNYYFSYGNGFIGVGPQNYINDANTWLLHTFVVDNGTAKGYKNGVLFQTSTGSNQLTLAESVIGIGTHWPCPPGQSTRFIGGVDNLGIWNRALTQNEITALYNRQPICTPPLASITPPSTTILCNNGGSINLNANTGSGLTYQWQLNGNDIQGATAATYAVVSPGSYTVTVSSGTNCQTTSSAIVITQGNTPLAPVSISGPAGACRGQNSVVFTTAAVSGATQYNWTLPSDATGSSTNNSISVSFGSVFNGGNISVSAVNSCGTSSAFSRSIALYTVKPATPGLISGPSVDVCSGTIHSYSVAAVANTTTYNWTVPTGCTIVSGQGSNSIQLTVPAGFVSGNVAVNAANCIGASTNRTLTIRGVPGTPGTITGPATTVCPGTTPTYSIASVLGASSYTWVMPTGVSLVSGQGTRTVVVSIQPGFVSGNIGVRAVGACGAGAIRNLAIRSVPPQPPSIIGQQDNLCGGNPYTYSTAGSASATSYTWTVPSGATFTNPTPTTCAVTFPASLNAGNVTVIANNACGASLPRSIAVTTAPKTPTTISGPASVCAGQQGVSYSVTPINGATNLQWQVPTGSTIVSGQGTPNITMNFGSTVGNVRVQAINACASGTTVQKVVGFTCRTEEGSEVDQTQEAGIENTAANYLTAYPNPATDLLTLNADELSLSERPFIIISDVAGRTVWSGQLVRNNMEIDLSAFSSGMYFIRANTSVALPVLRLVKH